MNIRSKPYVLIVAFALLSFGPVALGVDLDLTAREAVGDVSSVTVAPGATVAWEVAGLLDSDSDNEGLAGIVFDVSFDGGPVEEPASTAVSALEAITNTTGFGGTMIDGGLHQVGGAQDTIEGTPSVTTAIGHSEVILATGEVVAPLEAGTYTLSLTDITATVISDGEASAPYACEFAAVGAVTDLTIEVEEPELVAICTDLIDDTCSAARDNDYVWPIGELEGTDHGGFQSIDILFNMDVELVESCVTVQSNAEGTWPDPTTATLTAVGPEGEYTLSLDNPIPLADHTNGGGWTTIQLTVRPDPDPGAALMTVCFNLGWLPGDVNGDGQVSLVDATQFGCQFNGPKSLKRADLNDDGGVSLADSTKFGQIYSGTSGEKQWSGHGLGAEPTCDCP